MAVSLAVVAGTGPAWANSTLHGHATTVGHGASAKVDEELSHLKAEDRKLANEVRTDESLLANVGTRTSVLAAGADDLSQAARTRFAAKAQRALRDLSDVQHDLQGAASQLPQSSRGPLCPCTGAFTGGCPCGPPPGS